MSVSVNGPKTPVTKGSNGIAAATLPNICKMPGPPAPFVPAPLPNIGKSGDKVKGYSKKVKVEKKTVAIKGASFCSMGDMASKATGGGMISANTHGPCKFISPGSMDVKFEGKNVHLLTDLVTNNGGPSGSPANSATMMGMVNPTGVVYVPADIKCPVCEDKPEPHGDFGETEETQVSASDLVTEYGNRPRASRKGTMIGVAICSKCKQKYTGATTGDGEFFTAAEENGFHVVKQTSKKKWKQSTVGSMQESFFRNQRFKFVFQAAVTFNQYWRNIRPTVTEDHEAWQSVNPPGACAAQKALVMLLDHNCTPSGQTEKWYSREGERGEPTGFVRYTNAQGIVDSQKFNHGDSVPPCKTCDLLLPFLTCSKEKENSCPTSVTYCRTC